MKRIKDISPWAWVPTLYFAEGIPYFIVNVISVIMFKNMGMSNADVAMYTGLLYLPWVIKPLWSPFVDIIKTKRWWVLVTQFVVAAALAAAAFSLLDVQALSANASMPDATMSGNATMHANAKVLGNASIHSNAPMSENVMAFSFIFTLAVFWITAFASATHDIAADGFYMLALDKNRQSFFVGIRSTFYRLSSVFGQGVIVVVAGYLETYYENIPRAWMVTLCACAVLFGIIALYHTFFLPKPAVDRIRHLRADEEQGFVASASDIFKEFGRTFKTFFQKKHVWLAMLFMLLYRLPEAFLVKMLNPFLLDPLSKGGLGLPTQTVGIVYGTIGTIALTLGGILGGMAAAKWGLKKVMWPMALSLALPCAAFVYLSMAQPENIIVTASCIAFDQFGYGFGFTAYMLYMMNFSEGEFKTSHYSLCTAFMALSMMLPGMVAGYIQEALGYRGFFYMVMICCLATIFVTFRAAKRIDDAA